MLPRAAGAAHMGLLGQQEPHTRYWGSGAARQSWTAQSLERVKWSKGGVLQSCETNKPIDQAPKTDHKYAL